MNMIKELCRNNVGIGFYVGNRNKQMEGIKIIPDTCWEWSYDIGICTRKGRKLSKSTEIFIENMKNRLNADIHKFSFVPDMTDVNFASNASGVAIKYKLIGLEQIRSRKERFFKKAIQRRIELIFGVLSMLDNDFDFRDIELTFSDNIPANIKELSEIVKSLTGIVSQTKLLSLLPFINDPQKEMETINKENEDSLETQQYILNAGGEGDNE